MSGNKNKTIAFNYFGGKFSWLEHLYNWFPDDFTNLVELFSGSMAVSLNYRGRVIKTACEINGDITNFFQVLRDNEPELTRLLLLTPCSELEYKKCWEPADDKIEQARRFYVRVRQSFFGLGAQRKNKGWHLAKQKVNAKGGEVVSRWNNAIEKLHEVAEILRQDFQIINDDYRTVLRRMDFPKAFFYIDPPYPKEVRVSFNDYRFEFTRQDHIDLANELHAIKGLAMVSSYESDFYDDLYRDWNKIKLPVKWNNIRSSRVQEVIYMNYNKKQVKILFI